MKPLTLYRLLCIGAIALIVALGLSTKAYTGWGYEWVNNCFGDVLYEMAWIWFAGAIKPRWAASKIAIAIFIITSAIEFSQLISFPDAWTDQLWWRLLLGTHFDWGDFLYYAVGCVLGAVSLIWLRRSLSTTARA
ncbi:MAG: DUF2809 domain-containing protein [Phormidesmis sp.]